MYYKFTVQHAIHSEIIDKWTMDLEAIKHMALCWYAFDMYKVIALHKAPRALAW